jgi:hypothetical protein
LWWLVAGFGFAQLLCALLGAIGDRDALVDQLLSDMARRDAEFALTRSTAQLFLYAGLLIAVVIGVVVCTVVLVVAYQMRRGRGWARTILTVLGSFLVVLAVPSVFGLGTATGAVAVLAGGLAILGGVAAAGAIVLMHRRESNSYFLPGPPVR